MICDANDPALAGARVGGRDSWQAEPSRALLEFPRRRVAVIRLQRDDDGWLVVARQHGWLHSDLASARADAAWLSYNLDLPVAEVRR